MHIEVQNYRLFIDNLPERIKKSAFKTAGIIEKTGIPKASFYHKMKNNRFSLSEVEKISQLLYLEEQLDQKLAKGLEDLRQGKTHAGDKVLAEITRTLDQG